MFISSEDDSSEDNADGLFIIKVELSKFLGKVASY